MRGGLGGANILVSTMMGGVSASKSGGCRNVIAHDGAGNGTERLFPWLCGGDNGKWFADYTNYSTGYCTDPLRTGGGCLHRLHVYGRDPARVCCAPPC